MSLAQPDASAPRYARAAGGEPAHPGDGRSAEIRVSIAIGAAVLIQSAVVLVWAGGAAERLAQLERRAEASEELSVRSARLEEKVDALRGDIGRIEMKLEDLKGRN